MIPEELARRDENRLKLLRWLSDVSGGNEAKSYALRESSVLGMTAQELADAALYLHGEGLIRSHGHMAPMMHLTHHGIKEIEATVRSPDRQTEHFAPAIIQIVNNYFTNSKVGVVQTGGTDNSATVSQTVTDSHDDPGHVEK